MLTVDWEAKGAGRECHATTMSSAGDYWHVCESFSSRPAGCFDRQQGWQETYVSLVWPVTEACCVVFQSAIGEK